MQFDPIVYKPNKISLGFFRDYLQQSKNSDLVLEEAQYKLFNLPSFAAELFHRFFKEPFPSELENIPPENEWARVVHDQLSELPDFDNICQLCDCDGFAAGKAAFDLLDLLIDSLPNSDEKLKDPQPLREQVKELKAKDSLTAEEQKQLEEMIAAGKKMVQDAEEYAEGLSDNDAFEVRSILREISEQTLEKIEEYQDAVECLSWGAGPSPGKQSSLNMEQKAMLAELLKRSHNLKKIIELAGRMKEAAAKKRRSTKDTGFGELAGVSLGDELGRLLPTELQKLAMPELRPLFGLQYLEKTLIQYQVKGKETHTKGPLIVCVDVSDSMRGKRDIWAKALTLTLSNIAFSDKRHFRIIQFAERVYDIKDFTPNMPNFDQLIELVVKNYYGGGTNFQKPLDEAIKGIERFPELKNADIIFITDGDCDVYKTFLENFNKKRTQLEFTVYGFLVDDGYYSYSPESLNKFCDEVFEISDFTDVGILDKLDFV